VAVGRAVFFGGEREARYVVFRQRFQPDHVTAEGLGTDIHAHGAYADIAWATADALWASTRMIGGTPGRQIRHSAKDFDRAARMTYRAIPQPTRAGNGLRAASRLLAVLRTASTSAGIVLLTGNLTALAEETARLRLAQAHAHQAAAAKTAAERLAALRRDPSLLRNTSPARQSQERQHVPGQRHPQFALPNWNIRPEPVCALHGTAASGSFAPPGRTSGTTPRKTQRPRTIADTYCVGGSDRRVPSSRKRRLHYSCISCIMQL
jgi:hypothetical protein